MLKIILFLLGKQYKDLASITIYADGSGHITDESLIPFDSEGDVVFAFETVSALVRHLTKRAADGLIARVKSWWLAQIARR